MRSLRLLFALGVQALALALVFALPAAAQSITQSVRLPNQEDTESREDLKVAVLGGYVRINCS